jgi:hypothetical protein
MLYFTTPGSHRKVQPYEFSDGSIRADGDGPHIRECEYYLQECCDQLGLERKTLMA